MRIVLLLLMIGYFGYALAGQETVRQAGVRTEQEALFYFNYPSLSYILYLDGEVDLRHFPLIRWKDGYFSHSVGHRSTFRRYGESERSRLVAFMASELEGRSAQQDTTLFARSRFERLPNGILLHRWSIPLPAPREDETGSMVVQLAYLDFIQGDLLFRFCVPSVTTDLAQASASLNRLMEALSFFDRPVYPTDLLPLLRGKSIEWIRPEDFPDLRRPKDYRVPVQ